MLRKASEVVSEGNGRVHQDKKFGFGQPTPEDEFWEIRSQFDKLKKLMRRLEQHLLSQEQDVRQPRLAMEEADGHANTKTEERAEGAAKAVERCVGIAIMLNKRFKMDRRPRSLSGWTPNFPISLAGKTFWSGTALRRPSRVSHPWRCAQQQLPVA